MWIRPSPIMRWYIVSRESKKHGKNANSYGSIEIIGGKNDFRHIKSFRTTSQHNEIYAFIGNKLQNFRTAVLLYCTTFPYWIDK